MTFKNKHKSIKESGQVFTPDYIVCNMLDWIGYTNNSILQKHIIDNSCGDGAFLQEIVKRYCEIAKKENIAETVIAQQLSTYIHGIEIDDIAYNTCIKNLNEIINSYNIPSVTWDIINTDALTITHFNSHMDYVVGNPPYVRVHNLNEQYNKVKEFCFTSKGMTDLYLAFFEIGFNMLSPTGIMTYITPSSWINSTAAIDLRKYILKHKNLIALTDLEHYQAFTNITSYTIISQFCKSNKHADTFDYYRYNPANKERSYQNKLKYTEAYIEGNIYLSTPESIKTINSVFSTKDKKIIVKNGFATLKDKFFINDTIPESSFTIPVIKASTGKWSKGFFPYDKKGKPFDWDHIREDKVISTYLIAQKEVFFEDEQKDWYLYGRTQALADVHKNKYAISSIVKDKESIKINFVPPGCGIYSGLYILTDIDETTLKNLIISDSFIHYIQLLRKYKSGGYYTFNSKDLQQYLNYKINHE